MTLRRGLLTSWVRDTKKCNRDAGSHLGYHEAQFPGTENSGRDGESKFDPFGWAWPQGCQSFFTWYLIGYLGSSLSPYWYCLDVSSPTPCLRPALSPHNSFQEQETASSKPTLQWNPSMVLNCHKAFCP